MQYTVKISSGKHAGKEIQAEGGRDLLAVLREAGIAPDAPCGGHGTCGKCKVVADGAEVLSCQTAVDRDMKVGLFDITETNIMVDGVDVAWRMDPHKEGYLAAFDIGTTTVVCFLLDGRNGDIIANSSMVNPQEPYGADVISRIQASIADGKLEEQKTVIQKGMTKLIKDVCKKASIEPGEIGVISVVGNPTMQQLFMGISPENLATVPFAPVLTEAKAVPAKDYLAICPNADLLVVPDISGYVGADTMGCVLSTKMYDKHEITLMVDIGTNGELVLGNSERMAACSTAAGPALEGAKIKFGMRGAAGAIDHVWAEDGKLVCSVIGGGEATGICGSGLIDAVAAALDLEMLSETGRVMTEDTEPDADGKAMKVIRLRDGIYLTQNDIRELQLAKGAIAAGIILLAQVLGFEVSRIDKVLLAGAFGSFMNPKSACRIGLLPPVLDGRITAVGNAAGTGARLVVCDKGELALAQKLRDKIEFVELADMDDFQDTFVDNMGFGTDDD